MSNETKLNQLHDLAGEVMRTEGGYTQTRKLIAALSPEMVLSLVDCARVLQKALRDSGCDGDLCMHQWHEDARVALASVESAND